MIALDITQYERGPTPEFPGTARYIEYITRDGAKSSCCGVLAAPF